MLQQEQLESQLSMTRETKDWFHHNRLVTSESDQFGCIQVRTEWVKSPPLDIAARQLSQEHVKQLAQSFAHSGVFVDGKVTLLIFKEDAVGSGLDPKEILFASYLNSSVAPVPMYAIVGDHRSAAMRLLRATKPRNPDFMYMKVQVVLCNNTPRNRLMALTYGTMENTVESIRKKADSWDYIWQIHRYMEPLHAKYGDRMYANAESKKLLSDYRQKTKITMQGFTANTLGNFFVIANTWGQLWINISKIFLQDRENVPKTAKGKESKAKTAKKLGHGWLCHMSGIPEDDLISWTAQILTGDMTTSDFLASCQSFKNNLKAQNLIVDWYMQTTGQEVRSFSELARMYPFLTDVNFFEELMRHWPNKGKIATLPTGCADLLIRKMKSTVQVFSCCFGRSCFWTIRFLLLFFHLYKFFWLYSFNKLIFAHKNTIIPFSFLLLSCCRCKRLPMNISL